MRFNARATIILSSLIQLAMGGYMLVSVFRSGDLSVSPCSLPFVMSMAAVGGLVVQHPDANPILRPIVIIANMLILVLGICSFVFLFALAIQQHLPGDVPPIAWVLIGATILGPIFSNIIGIMLLPPPRGGNLY